MIRQIIHIDEEKCNGCGLCAKACHEAAIAIANGKARLLRDDYCDGLGNCLPACPTGAISFIQREAAAYDDDAVQENKRRLHAAKAEADAQKATSSPAREGTHSQQAPAHSGGCPGSKIRAFNQGQREAAPDCGKIPSQLRQWPVQIKLASIAAPYFDGADLLVAADCTAYAYGDFHRDFIRGRVTLIGCPKLDQVDYTEKLLAILSRNDVKSVTVARMEVPCCGGIEHAVRQAIAASGKDIPCRVVTVSIDGQLLG